MNGTRMRKATTVNGARIGRDTTRALNATRPRARADARLGTWPLGFALCTAVAVVALALAAPARAALDDPLEAYRAFARTPAARSLLADARAAMVAHFDGTTADAAPDTGAWPGTPAGVYVSLADGRLTRACVGSVTPSATLRGMVRELAVKALNADRRRQPVRREELVRLRVVVSLAGPGTPVADPMSVPLAREGLLVRSALGSVAFLPGEVRTVAYALREARRIGVLVNSGDAWFERFSVIAISEPAPLRASAMPRSHDEP